MKALSLLLLTQLLSVAAFGASHLSYHYDFESLRHNGAWTGEWYRVPGEPAVPAIFARILLPIGKHLKSVTVTTDGASAMEPMHFEVEPFPVPTCDDCGPKVEKTDRTFQAGERYPLRAWGDTSVQHKLGYSILYVPLFAAQYYPTEQQGITYQSADVEIDLAGSYGPEPLYRGLDADRDEVRALVDNPSMAASYEEEKPKEEPKKPKVEYVAIGPANLLTLTGENTIQTLLDDKKARGITAGKMSIEQIEKDYQGRDTQEKIRNAIRYYYQNFSTRYILLVGDGAEVNKVRRFYVDAYTPTLLASDVYFACLDGTFDGNGNGYYGELYDGPKGGAIDLSCEMAVGRAPVTDEAGVHAFVKKTLQMAKLTPKSARVYNTLVVGERMDGRTLGGWVLKNLIDGITLGMLKSTGFPKQMRVTKLNEGFFKSLDASDIVEAINEGDFYTVNHLGHASQQYAMKLMLQQLPYLKNKNPFFEYTQGCYAGDLTGRNWAAGLVALPTGGAAGIIANSAYGFYAPGHNEGQSSLYARSFYETAFGKGVHELGKIQYQSKQVLVNSALHDGYSRWVYYETNLLADPELKLEF